VEFNSLPQFYVISPADLTWVNKSLRRQTLMNSKEKIVDSWQIGSKPNA